MGFKENLMAGQSAEVTILFADICKSSQIYELLGDQKAREVVAEILNRLTDITIANNGKVIKTIGDAVMSIFYSADNASDAAKEMMAAMRQDFSKISDSFSVNIHAGFHHGSVIMDKHDVFGDAVNIASRLADYAKPKQIVTTKSTIEAMSERSAPLIRYIADITVKNISEPLIVYEILWDKREVTTIMDHQRFSYTTPRKLEMTVGDQMCVIDERQVSLTIGRMDYNDIVINLSWVSRSHVSIEYRKGIFMLADKSSNGTYVYPDDGDMKFVLRSECLLTGTGIILLGMDRDSETENVIIRYCVK
jgi:class 3 adenylate cyclase